MVIVAARIHVLCGLAAIIAAVTAMLARKGSRRHRRAGRVWLVGLAGLCSGAMVLASLDWAHRWHLVVLAAAAGGLATIGLLGARRAGPRWRAAHLTGMSGSVIAVLTAFYVDNGPRLPLWNQLPPTVLWFLPCAVGLPLMLRALRRHVRPQPSATAGTAHRG